MTSDTVDHIIGNREPEYSGQRPEQKYETWLYTDGIVTLDVMKQLLPFITTGGCVYRAQIVGYFDEGGTSTRVEAVVDTSPLMVASTTDTGTGTSGTQGVSGAGPSNTGGGQSQSGSSASGQSSTSQSQTPSQTYQAVIGVPRIVFWRDITNLGRGFPLEILGTASGG
jgi:hypothetical protein